MLTLGIDDAGRGPIIGDMVLAGVVLNDEQSVELSKHPVDDSKKVAHPTRVRVSSIIKDLASSYHVISSSPAEIDDAVLGSSNLNTLEAKKAADIINKLNDPSKPLKVVVDCPSVNTEAWKNTMMSFVDHVGNLTVLSEHKADANHLSVAAASILAKVQREDSVAELKTKFGDFGSGYPADPKTKEFLREKGAEFASSGIFRKSWSTWRKLFPVGDQSTLSF